MKKIILTLVCIVIAESAFAQSGNPIRFYDECNSYLSAIRIQQRNISAIYERYEPQEKHDMYHKDLHDILEERKIYTKQIGQLSRRYDDCIKSYFNNDVLLEHIKDASQHEIFVFNTIKNEYLGVYGWDPIRHYVGTSSVPQKFSWKDNPIPIIKDIWTDRNWYPIDGYKHHIIGTLYDFKGHFGDFFSNNPVTEIVPFAEKSLEYDWNIRLIPDARFQYLIQDVKNKYINYINNKTLLPGDGDAKDWDNNKCGNSEYNCIEIEISPNKKFSTMNEFFKLEDKNFINVGTSGNINGYTPLGGKKIGMYGVWVVEEAHNFHPEIHPAELVWFENENDKSGTKQNYTMIILQDNTEFFNDPDDYIPNNNSPWSSSPITGQFKIPISLNLSDDKVVKKVTITHRMSQDVHESDKYGQNLYAFNINNLPRLVVELKGMDGFCTTHFTDIRKISSNEIIGYLTITSKIGNNKNGDGYDKGAYLMFKTEINNIDRSALNPNNTAKKQQEKIEKEELDSDNIQRHNEAKERQKQ